MGHKYEFKKALTFSHTITVVRWKSLPGKGMTCTEAAAAPQYTAKQKHHYCCTLTAATLFLLLPILQLYPYQLQLTGIC